MAISFIVLEIISNKNSIFFYTIYDTSFSSQKNRFTRREVAYMSFLVQNYIYAKSRPVQQYWREGATKIDTNFYIQYGFALNIYNLCFDNFMIIIKILIKYYQRLIFNFSFTKFCFRCSFVFFPLQSRNYYHSIVYSERLDCRKCRVINIIIYKTMAANINRRHEHYTHLKIILYTYAYPTRSPLRLYAEKLSARERQGSYQ